MDVGLSLSNYRQNMDWGVREQDAQKDIRAL
jgi:hypothetical protein